MTPSEPKVFLGIPTHTRQVDMSILNNVARAGIEFANIQIGAVSALCYNFNRLWCNAYNGRKSEGYTHFALLHSDIECSEGWAATLLREMAANNLAVLSAVVPIKGDSGLTSTAVASGPLNSKQMMLAVCAAMPPTFTSADVGDCLLINTGCLMIDMRRVTPGHVCFTAQDWIVQDRDTHTYEAHFEPEDWRMSRALYSQRIPYGATTAVKVSHIGTAKYSNQIADYA